jgi:hypothetical protein
MEIWVRLFLAALVVALLAGLVGLLRRTGLAAGLTCAGKNREVRWLTPLGRLALTPHHSVHALRAGERILIVATYPGGCALLESQPAIEANRRAGEASSCAA